MSKLVCSIVFSFIVSGFVGTLQAQGNLAAKVSPFQPPAADAAATASDREQDGLAGPVRRIKTEVAKLSNSAGKSVEDKRVMLESSAYDLKGKKTENAYFPVAGAALTGREVYKYDDKGNISEMTLHGPDGSLVSKEVYKYEFDFAGNWTRMTASVAVVEGGKLSFEPTEVTYRTIMYYLNENMTKMLQPAQPVPGGTSPVQPATGANSEAKPKPAASSPALSKLPDSVKFAESPPAAKKIDTGKFSISPVGESGTPLATKRPGVELVGEAPVVAVPKPLLKPVSGGVLNGAAINLPAPTYPEVARRMRASGLVVVEVVIDENGKVLSARAVSGNTILKEAAVHAAYRARFSPTKLSGQPVKVAGVINYNFNLTR